MVKTKNEMGVSSGLDLEYIDNAMFHSPDAEKFVITNGVKIEPIGAWFSSLRVVDDGREAPTIPLLTANEERSLFLQYNYCRKQVADLTLIGGDNPPAAIARETQKWVRRALAVREVLAERNLSQVITLVAKFDNSGLDHHDRVSEGQDVLLKAIDKFDVDRGSDGDRTFAKKAGGNKFSTYLWWALSKRFQKMITRAKNMPSLDEQMEGSHYGDVADPTDTRQDNSSILAIELVNEVLNKNLAGLSDLELQVIRLRFFTTPKPSLDTVAHQFGLNKATVSDLEKRAFKKLREVLERSL